MSPVWCRWPCYDISQGFDIIAYHFVLSSFRSQLLINILLSNLQSLLVSNRQSRLLFLDLSWLLAGSFNLSKSIVGVQGNWLHLILVC